MIDPVKDFWDTQAKTYGTSDLATAPDHHYRELEIREIKRTIEAAPHETILDIGCGNGYSTIELAKEFSTSTIIGVDYSEKMIEQAKIAANAAGIQNITFFVGDVLSISRHPELQHLRFDMVLSERCLINLANWDEQKLAILQLRKMLTPEGHLILVENMKDGLEKLNKVRSILDLPPISERWHNFYIPEVEFKEFLDQVKGKLLQPVHVENIGNNYYLMSRVLYAKLASLEGEEPNYDHPINKIAAQLPTFGTEYACSPNYLMVFKNVADEAEPWDAKKKFS